MLWPASSVSKVRKVPTATGELTFEVSGAARLIAVDNGDHLSDDLFAGNKKVWHNGFAMAIQRSAQTAGTVQVKVTGAGLKQAVVTFIITNVSRKTFLTEIVILLFRTLKSMQYRYSWMIVS